MQNEDLGWLPGRCEFKLDFRLLFALRNSATEVTCCQGQRASFFGGSLHVPAWRYSVTVPEAKNTVGDRVGLCMDCQHMRPIRSDRGSTFFLCGRSATEPDFPKYPRLPVLQCLGYEKMPGGSRRLC